MRARVPARRVAAPFPPRHRAHRLPPHDPRRRFEEKERRKAQEQQRLARERQVAEKVAARSFAKGFLAELHSSVVDNLRDAGFFYDPLEAEVSNTFLPWLLDEMDGTLEKQRIARELADQLVAAAGMRHAVAAAEASKLKAEIEAAKAKAEEEAAAAAAAVAAAADPRSRSTRRSRRFSRRRTPMAAAPWSKRS